RFSEFAFQHQRITNTTDHQGSTSATTVLENNIEIMNPIFNADGDESEMIVNYMVGVTMVRYPVLCQLTHSCFSKQNTNFSNPIYDYKKLMDKNKEETENLLESAKQ